MGNQTATGDGDQHCEQGLQSQSQTDQKNEMAEVHRIAAVGVRPGIDETIGRSSQAGSAAAVFDPVKAAKTILQITPDKQRRKPEIE